MHPTSQESHLCMCCGQLLELLLWNHWLHMGSPPTGATQHFQLTLQEQHAILQTAHLSWGHIVNKMTSGWSFLDRNLRWILGSHFWCVGGFCLEDVFLLKGHVSDTTWWIKAKGFFNLRFILWLRRHLKCQERLGIEWCFPSVFIFGTRSWEMGRFYAPNRCITIIISQVFFQFMQQQNMELRQD